MLNESNIPLEEDGIEEEILVDEEVAITKAMWGDVGGNIENQTDLKNALDAKQDNLTEAQLNAVNSGITNEKVTTYDGYADQIASKADQSALNAETIARGEADTALGTRIDNEALARQQTDNGLQSQIDAITSKSDVVDVVANYAALQAYDTSTLGNNDVVKVLDDETHEDALTYYRWSTTTQTWSYIGQEAPYYSKGQMDVKLAEKQDKLTAGANIQIQNGTISATDTTYTAGNGLNLNGTEFSADTDVLATKEDLEGYYTKPETDNLLAPKLEAEVVTELPTTGAEGKLYLTPKAHTTSTATGNPIEATVTEQAGQLESFQLDGDTFQQTYTGKNLYNVEAIPYVSKRAYSADGSEVNWSNYTGTNEYQPVEPNTEYTIWNNKARDTTYLCEYDENKNFIQRTIEATTFTTTATTKYLRWSIYVGAGEIPPTQTQLELGSTATSFEPFVGGQPSPSPDYPQPIQTVTGRQVVNVKGKNLFVPPNSATSRGVTFTKNEDGSFNISGEAVGGEALCSIYTDINLKDGESLTLSSNVGLSTGVVYRVEAYNGNTWITSLISQTSIMPKTITIPQNVTRLRYSIGLLEGREVNLTNVTFQLEKGTATAYEPYSSNDYEINLGKNLFNRNDVVKGIPANTDGSIVSTTSVGRTSDYIPVTPNTTYSHTGHPLGWANVAWYKADKSFIKRNSDVTTVTSPSEAAYARVSCAQGNLDTCQFEAGEPTDYAPYFEPIELCKLDTYQDYIWKDGEDWKVHKDVGVVVYDGSDDENWSKDASGAYARMSIFESLSYDVGAMRAADSLCGHFRADTVNAYGIFFRNNRNIYFYPQGSISLISEWRTWLSSNNIIVYYPLNTATDTTITDQTLIAQLEAIRTAALQNGTNTITNTATGTNLAGDMEIGYYGFNPTNRYDKWLWLDLNNNYEQIGGE